MKTQHLTLFGGATIICLSIVGCFAPSDKLDSAKKKVARIEAKESTNNSAMIKRGVAAVDAAQYALSKDTNASPPVVVAKDVLDRAQMSFAAGGAIPDVSEVIFLRKMVDNLLSTNAVLIAQGEKAKIKFEQEIVASDIRAGKLEAEKEKMQEKLDKVITENAALADTWWTIKTWFWRIVWTVVIIAAIRLVCAFIPPPYNSVGLIFDYLFGLMFKAGSRILPKAVETAGVVKEEAFAAVIEGVGKYRKELQTISESNGATQLSHSDALASFDNKMLKATELGDRNFKPLIEKYRDKVGAR